MAVDVLKGEISFGQGPFLFSGKPPFLQGTVNIINSSEERVRVSPVVLEAAGCKAHPYRGRAEEETKPKEKRGDLLRVRISKQIKPFEQADLPAEIVVDERTPPGEYEGQLRFGDQRAQALVFVLENGQLRLVPNQINIKANAGETITQSVYVINEGNIPFSTRRAAFAPLQELDMLHSSLAIALNEAGHEGHTKFLDRFVSELADAEVPPAKVKIDVQDQEIAPGETKLVEITIRIPGDVKKNKTYTSSITFKDTALDVEVEVNGAAYKTKGRPR